MKKKMVLAVSIAILVVLCSCMFMACTQDPTKVKAKYEDKGYTVINLTKDGKGIMNVSKSIKDSCVITFFETEDKAKVAEADAKKLFDAAKEDDKDTTFAYKRSGNAVAVGSKTAVKIL